MNKKPSSEENKPSTGAHKKNTLSSRVVTSNKLVTFLLSLKDRKDLIEKNSDIDAISSYTRDRRKIRIMINSGSYDVEIGVFFKLLVQEILNKGRVEDSDDWKLLAARTAVQLLTRIPGGAGRSELYLGEYDVDKDRTEYNANASRDPFVIRTKLILGFEQDTDLVKGIMRDKAKSAEDRKNVIPEAEEHSLLPVFYEQALNDDDISEMERIYLYYLLIDKKFSDLKFEFTYNRIVISVRLRELLKDYVNYAFGVTYYSKNLDEERRMRCIKHECRTAVGMLINRIYRIKSKEESDVEIKNVIENIKKSLTKILYFEEERMREIEEMESIYDEKVSLPKEVIEQVQTKLERLVKGNDFIFHGICGIYKRRFIKEHLDK